MTLSYIKYIFIIIVAIFCNTYNAFSKDFTTEFKYLNTFFQQHQYFKKEFTQQNPKSKNHTGYFVFDRIKKTITIEYITQPLKIEITPKETRIIDTELSHSKTIPTQRSPMGILLSDKISDKEIIIHKAWSENNVHFYKLQHRKYRDYGIVDIGIIKNQIVRINIRDYSNNIISELIINEK